CETHPLTRNLLAAHDCVRVAVGSLGESHCLRANRANLFSSFGFAGGVALATEVGVRPSSARRDCNCRSASERIGTAGFPLSAMSPRVLVVSYTGPWARMDSESLSISTSRMEAAA